MKSSASFDFVCLAAARRVGSLRAIHILVAVALLGGLGGCVNPRNEADQVVVQAQVKIEKEKDYEAGVRLALKATTTDPSDPNGWYWLGVGYYDARQFAQAVPALKKAIALGCADDQYWSAYNLLADVSAGASDAEALKALIANMSKVPPTTAFGYNERGLFYLHCAMLGYAIQDLHKAVSLDPKQPLFAQNLAFSVERIDPLYGESYRKNPSFDMLLTSKEAAVEVARWRNRTLIEAKDQLLPNLLSHAKSAELEALTTKLEQVVLDLEHEGEMAKEKAEQAEINHTSDASNEVDTQRELSLIYRERIALLKPILASVREEIANRQK